MQKKILPNSKEHYVFIVALLIALFAYSYAQLTVPTDTVAAGSNELSNLDIEQVSLSRVEVMAADLYAEARGIDNRVVSSDVRSVIDAVKRNMPGIENPIVVPSKIEGIYAVIAGGKIAYIDKSASYILAGTLIELSTGNDLGAQQKEEVSSMQVLARAYESKPDESVTNNAAPRPGSEAVVQPGVSDSEEKTKSNSPLVSSGYPAQDTWPASGIIPENYLAQPAQHSAQSLGQMQVVATNHPNKITSGRINVESIIRSHLAGRLPDDRYSVVYPQTGVLKGTLTVFADPTCSNCQRFHSELPIYTQAGILVKYLLFPRNAEDEVLKRTLNSVYCTEDNSERQHLLDKLYADNTIELPNECGAMDVDGILEAAEFYGISGTPTIMSKETGLIYAGYVPVESVLLEMGVNGAAQE